MSVVRNGVEAHFTSWQLLASFSKVVQMMILPELHALFFWFHDEHVRQKLDFIRHVNKTRKAVIHRHSMFPRPMGFIRVRGFSTVVLLK